MRILLWGRRKNFCHYSNRLACIVERDFYFFASGSIYGQGRIVYRSLGSLLCYCLNTDWCGFSYLFLEKLKRESCCSQWACLSDTLSKLGNTNSQLCNNRVWGCLCVRVYLGLCECACLRVCSQTWAQLHMVSCAPSSMLHSWSINIKSVPPSLGNDIQAWLSLCCLCHSVSVWHECGCLSVSHLSPSLCAPFHSAGMGKKDDPKLMQEWFKLVQEKNALVRYESELMIL